MAIPSTIINEYITKQKKELINNITTGKKNNFIQEKDLLQIHTKQQQTGAAYFKYKKKTFAWTKKYGVCIIVKRLVNTQSVHVNIMEMKVSYHAENEIKKSQQMKYKKNVRQTLFSMNESKQ